MTRFWLVRHGPTHQKTFTGWRDVPADLSDTEAVGRLAGHLPQRAVFVSSDLKRAVATVQAIVGERQMLPPRQTLREFDFGAWDGLHHTEVAARDPDLSRRFWEEPGDLTAPDGESWNMVARRVRGSLEELATQRIAADVVVVGHMGMIMTMIAACGGTPYQAMGHQIAPLSVTDMNFDGASWRIGTINHLA